MRTLQALQDAGGCGLAITNDAESPLARAADAAIDLDVGEERAVPATKTVTGQLTAFAIVASALGRVGGVRFTRGELDTLPMWVQAVLDDSAPAAAAAPALADMVSLVEELRARQASVLIVGDRKGADVWLPGEAPETLAPILAVVRGQQLSYELALRLGRDPDSPAGLTKVTAT